MQPKRTRRTEHRLTLSATIASQTIESSPDGSEISSAAKGTPAATVGRLCASSTATSSSNPCNDTLGHSRRRNGPARAANGGGAILAAHCPDAEYPLEYAVSAS